MNLDNREPEKDNGIVYKTVLLGKGGSFLIPENLIPMPVRRPKGLGAYLFFLMAAATLVARFGPGSAGFAADSGIPGFGGRLGGDDVSDDSGETASSSGMAGLLGEGIDFRGGMLDWEEDDDGHRVAILRNYAVVILPQVTISARNMILNVELQEIYAEGDVVFDEPGGNSFYCDQMTFNYNEWTGLAKNIRIKMDNKNVTLPVKDFLDDAPSTALTRPESLSAGDQAGPLRRMYVQAQELRAHNADTFELIDAKITPDSFARPKWYFRSPAALLRRNEKIESYHNTVNIGKFPVVYFPYLIRDLKYDWPWMRVSGGYSGDHGYFAQTQWGWRLNPDPDSYFRLDKVIFDLDYFTKRGVGVGTELEYSVGHWESLGKLKLYGVWEYAISEGNDYERSINDNADKIYLNTTNVYGQPIPFHNSLYRHDFRWAVDWQHYQQLNELWDIRAEAHLYHDRDYLKDYDSWRYWNEKEPENSIDIRRLDRLWELEFVASSRLSNKWMTQSDYYPEVRLTIPGLQLGTLPLFLKDDMRIGVVDKHFDNDAVHYQFLRRDGIWGLDEWGQSNSRLWNKGNYGSIFRAHNELRLEAPIHIAEAFTVKPWVGLRTTYYSKTLGDPVSDEYLLTHPNAVWNGIPYNSDYEARRLGVFTPGQLHARGGGEAQFAVPFGLDLSTRTYTVFGAHDQWRLTTEPVISYLENPHSRLDYNKDIFPIDEFDVYNRQRRFGFELHNKLQRRYYENSSGPDVPTRDILDFSLRFYYYPIEEQRMLLNYNRRLTELAFDVVYRPIERLTLSSSIDYDTADNTIDRGIFTVDWRLSNLFRVIATHYHYRGDYWKYPTNDYSSQTYLALRTKLWNDSSHYTLETAVAYEWRDSNEWKNSHTGVRHGFNQYRVTLFRDLDTFELSLSYVRNRYNDNHGVYFTLAPKSFMGVDRPPPTYSPVLEELGDGRYGKTSQYAMSDAYVDAPVIDADLKDVEF